MEPPLSPENPQAPPPGAEEAREEIQGFLLQTEMEPLHVRQVARLALQLFDGLAPLHGLGPRERLLLEGASYLHDIGHIHDAEPSCQHHLESARLIREYHWKHFAPGETEIMAQVARYHRKSIPELTDKDFAALPEHARRLVTQLASLLRIADSLDRSHAQCVTQVNIELPPNRIVLRLEATAPVLREVLAAYRKGDLAQRVFQRDLIVMVGDELIPNIP